MVQPVNESAGRGRINETGGEGKCCACIAGAGGKGPRPAGAGRKGNYKCNQASTPSPMPAAATP